MRIEQVLLCSLKLLQRPRRLSPVPQDEPELERGVGQQVRVRPQPPLRLPGVPRDGALEKGLCLLRGAEVFEAHGLEQGHQAQVIGVELFIL